MLKLGFKTNFNRPGFMLFFFSGIIFTLIVLNSHYVSGIKI